MESQRTEKKYFIQDKAKKTENRIPYRLKLRFLNKSLYQTKQALCKNECKKIYALLIYMKQYRISKYTKSKY